MLGKYVNYSTNPLWCIVHGRVNHFGLALASLAVLEYAIRPADLLPSLSRPGPVVRTPRLAIVLGLGSLIHLVQTFLADAGTIIAWTWTGYPVTGPMLHPFGPVVIASATLGTFCQTPWYFVLGAPLVYWCTDWLGFAGGLALVCYLAGLIPQYLRAATMIPDAFGLALALNCVLDVLAVVTTAYAFVPYGWLLRERTDLILLFTVCSVEIGRRAISRLSLPETPVHRFSPLRNRLAIATALVMSVIAAVSIKSISPKPYTEHRMFTAGIWTVSAALDPAHI